MWGLCGLGVVRARLSNTNSIVRIDRHVFFSINYLLLVVVAIYYARGSVAFIYYYNSSS